MLDSLRKSSRSWVAKGLLLLLLASFAVWGVSGQIITGGAGDAVVTAGQTKVSVLDYRLAYDRQLAVYSNQLGERITREQARLFGIDRQVLGQLVAGAVLDEQSRVMNLGLSKDRLAGLVAEDPAFQGINGQFSRQNFSSVLRSVGMSEDEYIRNREEVAIRQQVIEAVADDMAIPDTLLEALALHSGETRNVDYITVTEQAIEPVMAPDDATLRAFFDERKQNYSAPEYRTVSFVRLTPSEIVDEASVAEEEVRADYEARKNRFATPETRTIEQIVFEDDARAAAANERILAGQSFEEAVADAGRTMADVALGTLEKSDLPDPAVAEAAFALESAGAVSGVIDGAFGPVIVRVTEINPEAVQSYDEVKDQIRRDLALIEANDVLLDIHDAYEDARAGGQTMQEAAASQKLRMQTIEGVDAEGRDQQGEAVTSIAEQQELVAAAFEAERGIENPPINAGETGFIWYEVDDIVPSRERTFEEVRDRVEADWIAAETSRRVEEQAVGLAERLAGGETLAEIAGEAGYTVQTKFGLQRDGTDVDFGNAGTAEVFDGGPEHSGAVAAPSENAYNVFKVTGVAQALGGADAVSQQQRDNLRSAMSDDLLDQMVAKLQTVFPVQVDQRAIERALAVQ